MRLYLVYYMKMLSFKIKILHSRNYGKKMKNYNKFELRFTVTDMLYLILMFYLIIRH